jgi:hypothetical protein
MKFRFEQMNPMNAKDKIRLLTLLFSKGEPMIAGKHVFFLTEVTSYLATIRGSLKNLLWIATSTTANG